jgi:hypothetical protein
MIWDAGGQSCANHAPRRHWSEQSSRGMRRAIRCSLADRGRCGGDRGRCGGRNCGHGCFGEISADVLMTGV